jgi:hypothetical protein
MMEKLLTVPDVAIAHREYLATGNRWLALPDISASGGALALSVLSDALSCSVSFLGSPLFAPFVEASGERLELRPLGHSYDSAWLPRFRFEAVGPGGIAAGELDYRIVAPAERRGFVLELDYRPAGLRPGMARPGDIALGVEGRWLGASAAVFHARPLPAERSIVDHAWTKSVVLKLGSVSPIAAIALGGEPGAAISFDAMTLAYRVERRFDSALSPRCAEGGAGDAGGGAARAFFFGAVNREEDGAGTCLMDLRRRGGEELVAEAEAWLDARRARARGVTAKGASPASAAPRLDERVERNRFFSCFFAAGRAIDGESLLLLTSRSDKYYVSAAFWSRDTLLWSLPSLLDADPGFAREVILTCYTRYLRNAGIHALYLDGSVLYPGFELDELAAYFIALDAYIKASGDRSILEERDVRSGIPFLVARLASRYDSSVGLFSTELDPSDDPVDNPYLLYDNALVLRSIRFLEGVGRAEGAVALGVPSSIDFAQRVRSAFTVDGPEGKIFAWSSDGRGSAEIYDDPPGSLLLLPMNGFCASDDPVWMATVCHIHSDRNPYWYGGVRFASSGCLHTPHPWPMALCNRAIAARQAMDEGAKGAQRLAPLDPAAIRAECEEMEMDGGFACESVDRETGLAATGAAFATFAGFYAHALGRLP